MNISILNLPRDVSQDQLRQLFEPYGTVVSASLVMDKDTQTSKGFGFVQMDNAQEAEAAIAALHGSKIGKEKLRVKQVEQKD